VLGSYIGAVQRRAHARYDRHDVPPPEPTMLVNCVAYQNGKKLADIPVEETALREQA
jgi:hypothetical protein